MAQGMIDISILGDKQLQFKLNRLGKQASKVARKALRAGARPILASARANAPKDTGKLKRGIKLRSIKRSRRFIGVVVRLPTREELGLSEGQFYYPAAIEFGYKKKNGQHVPAVRPLRAALDGNRNKSLNIIKDTFAREIVNAIAR